MPNLLVERIAALDWIMIQQTLDEQGYAEIPALLDKDQCNEIMNTYEEKSHFRSTIDMARYRFGIGEYKYYQALNQKETDYTGGEFLLMEQRPRAQSRGHVITLEQGAGLIFPANHRSVHGSRGYYKTKLRHGVSTITSGTRYTLGIIFHDAK